MFQEQSDFFNKSVFLVFYFIFCLFGIICWILTFNNLMFRNHKLSVMSLSQNSQRQSNTIIKLMLLFCSKLRYFAANNICERISLQLLFLKPNFLYATLANWLFKVWFLLPQTNWTEYCWIYFLLIRKSTIILF